MVDPFLLAHRLGPRCCSIGGKISPVAVRDQMVRAELFVERAWKAGWLSDPQGRPLLVVGAGAGGATAALHAATNFRVNTVVVDREPFPFRVQLECPTRWIDPTIYDFPVDHWQSSQYPPHAPAVVPHLAWDANWAHLVAMHWTSVFFPIVQAQVAPIEFKPSTKLADVPQIDPSGDFVKATIIEAGVPRDLECVLVLFALGPGRERTFLLDENERPCPSQGYPFWMQDPIGAPDLGLAGGSPSILISGAGDGALQDFLRIATICKSADEIYAVAPLDEAQLCTLHSAQRRAERAYAWGSSSHTDHKPLQILHDAVQRIVDAKYSREGDVIRNVLLGLLRDPLPDVQLFFECTHFTNCYLLNHYLVLLVARAVAERLGKQVLCPCRRLTRIAGANGHICNGSPIDCYGNPHEIEWATVADCRDAAMGPGGVHHANVLVIRHGTILDPLSLELLPPYRRQLLPYFLPD